MVPDGWTLASVPITLPDVPALEAALAGSGALRRYGAGGQVAWIAIREPQALEGILVGRGLTGLRVAGAPAANPLIGRDVTGEVGRRVRVALDPSGRFGGA